MSESPFTLKTINSILEVTLIQPNVNLESKRNINLKYDNLENLIN